MAVTATIEDTFTFVGGLNTEGGVFTTPKNSWVDGTNVIPQTDGSIKIREALELENSFDVFTLPATINNTQPADTINNVSSTAYVTHKWENVNGNPELSFFVVQSGQYVYFYDATKAIVSENKKSFSINLNDYKVDYSFAFDSLSPIQVTSFYGKLLLTHKHIDPLALTYIPQTDTILTSPITIKIRDFSGIYTGYADNVEKSATEWETLGLKKAVIYNLLNQGWNATQIDAYVASQSKLPSNTKQWIFGKDSSDVFSATELNKQEFGTSPAPKGRNVIEAFNQRRFYPNDYLVNTGSYSSPNTQTPYLSSDPGTPVTTGILTDNALRKDAGQSIYVETTTGIYENVFSSRPSACAFFAGRAWYAGAEDDTVNSWVMYSQITDDVSKLGSCYQKNDPTAEVVSDLVDDDGGLILIQNSGKVHALAAVGTALLVFASNGVWSIYGGDAGFKATSYIVDKVTDVGCISPLSVVLVENAAFYWANEGIYSVTVDSSGLAKADNASTVKIKNYYNSIQDSLKRRCVGVYDKVNKIIYWLFGTNLDKPAYKDTILAAHIQIGCFYTLTFPKTSAFRIPAIIGFNLTEHLNSTTETFNVVVNGNNVIVGAGNNVVTEAPISSSNEPILKFLVLYTEYALSTSGTDVSKITFADLQKSNQVDSISFTDFSSFTPLTDANNITLRDRYEPNEVPYPSKYILLGYSFGNNGPARHKSITYVTVFAKRTEESVDELGIPVNASSCLMQSRWDFADNANTGKWSESIQVYRPTRVFLSNASETLTTGYPLVVSKNRLRGRGKAFQIKLEAEENKNMHIYGWSINITGNTNV